MKIDKTKVLSMVGLVVASVITTVFSTAMQDREIDKKVEEHLAAIESKEEEA